MWRGKVIKEESKAIALPRIAASSYLNTAPLIWSFQNESSSRRVELLTHQAPARCALMLDAGEADAALVPVIEYQRMTDVALVKGVCVGSRERVRSVVLATRNLGLEQVRSVALDTSSRTSAALIRVLFREFIGVEPEWRTSEPDLNAMLEDADAALIIGDPAMTFPREGLRVYDLASLWREHTGLGFVFAMWMVRDEARERLQTVDFTRARDEGLRRVDEITAAYQQRLGIERSELRQYLLENICFELDDELVAGLQLFYRLAHKHGIVPSLKAMRWMG